LLQAHHAEQPRALNEVRPDVPVELAATVAKMMAKKPEHRHQQPIEVAQAIALYFRQGIKLLSLGTTTAGVTASPSDSAGSKTANPSQTKTDSPPPSKTLDSPPQSAGRQETVLEHFVDPSFPTGDRSVKGPKRDAATKLKKLWISVGACLLVVGLLGLWTGVLFTETRKLDDQSSPDAPTRDDETLTDVTTPGNKNLPGVNTPGDVDLPKVRTLDGAWWNGVNGEGRQIMTIVQTGDEISANCVYRHPQAGEISWRLTGTVTDKGRIHARVIHTRAPRGWKDQTHTATVSADGNRISGRAEFDGGGGHDYVWTREAPTK
jgi:hypothetical protein